MTPQELADKLRRMAVRADRGQSVAPPLHIAPTLTSAADLIEQQDAKITAIRARVEKFLNDDAREQYPDYLTHGDDPEDVWVEFSGALAADLIRFLDGGDQ